MKQILIIISSVIIFFSACTDSDLIVDTDGNHLNNYGKLYKDTLTAINSTCQEYGKISTGSSPRLILGAYEGFEGRFLVKFNKLPADSIKIDSVYFLIQSVSNYGSRALDFTGTIKMVTKDWDENVNTDEDWSYQNNVLHTEFTTDFNVSIDDSMFYSIPVPDTIVSIWRDTTDNIENHGLMVDFENAATIKEFSSVNSTISPKIVYVYRDAAKDSVIRDTTNASKDASLIDYSGSLPNDSLLYITSGFSHRAFIEFDLSSIPKDIEISYVNFIIKPDTIASDVNANQTSSFYLRTATTPFNTLPSFEVDSTFKGNLFHNVSILKNDDKNYEISEIRRGETGKYFIGGIINESITYGSFLIHFAGEGNRVSIQAIKGTKDISEDNKPKMIIEYFEIPKSRL